MGEPRASGPIDLPTPVSYNEAPTPSELAVACRSVEFASQARNQFQLVAGLFYQAMWFLNRSIPERFSLRIHSDCFYVICWLLVV